MTMRALVPPLIALCACAHAQKAAPVAAQAAAVRPPAPQIVEVPPAVLYKEARESMARGDWDTARQRLQDYLKREPKNAAALFDAGWIAEKRGEPKDAGGLYARALQADPAHAGAALNLARLLRLEERTAEAEDVLRAALQRRADDPRILGALASLLREQKKLDEAEAAVRRALQRHPDDAGAYRILAAIEADRGRVRLAESALASAGKLDGKDPAIPNALGLLAMARGDAATARASFEQAARLDPAFAPAWANLGALALRYRDYAASEEAYAKAVEIDGRRWDTRLAHGWALEGLRRPKEARAEYEKALELKPGQEDALYGRALALKAENDLPAALQAFREYAANAKAAHVKEAQQQIAAIDLRLKNPPAQKPGPPPESGKAPEEAR